MHIHILGIGGTFMGGLAILAKELNLKVTGADGPLYPPMSTQLEAQGIELIQGYEADQINLRPDCFVIGNVMKRGLPVIEAILDQGLPFVSGPEWLAKNVLKNRIVLAVSGTHGKTTTSSMLAWILEYAGLQPGFLIGGIPNNFGISARLGKGPYFVVEADEYDSAFFDKRSKFIHYLPKILIINNIEFDHADIFSNLDAIKTQFHHLVRIVPQSGRIIVSGKDPVISEVLNRGVWTPVTRFYSAFDDANDNVNGSANGNSSANGNGNVNISTNDLFAKTLTEAGDSFEIWKNIQKLGAEKSKAEKLGAEKREPEKLEKLGTVTWELLGRHNVENALAAMSAANAVGVPYETAMRALSEFKGVKRRLEVKADVDFVTVYDDFAHHPTAIETTLKGLRAKKGQQTKISVVVDIRSNTMKAGYHQEELGQALQEANEVYFYKTKEVAWDVEKVMQGLNKPGGIFSEPEPLLDALKGVMNRNASKDQLVFMSNGGFAGIIQAFLKFIGNCSGRCLDVV